MVVVVKLLLFVLVSGTKKNACAICPSSALKSFFVLFLMAEENGQRLKLLLLVMMASIKLGGQCHLTNNRPLGGDYIHGNFQAGMSSGLAMRKAHTYIDTYIDTYIHYLHRYLCIHTYMH